MRRSATGKRGFRLALGVVAVAALAGMGIAALLFASWTETSVVSPDEAGAAFRQARAALGPEPPYVRVTPDGVEVRRELESVEPVPLEALHLLAWRPDSGRLVRVSFPFWFVRVKMSRRINLGTLTAALARDWRHIDLSVSEDDLSRRGPGLILDETLGDGARILLWTE